MALNSPLHDIYLSMPIEATLLPQLHGLSYWGRTVYEILHELNPRLMCWLAENQRLRVYIERKQEHLQKEAFRLEREWRRLNPLKIDSGYLARVCWLRHCQLAVRELLIDEITKSLLNDTTAV